mmetsp:Transcript_18241/g.25702  ORF Transcript_18241/g.25702 Transcript_18241/m.25702 type:complete len:317 (-) Transcript_18241:309-1259(-)
MARGSEAKARRKEARKNKKEGIDHDFGMPEPDEDSDLPMPPSAAGGGAPIEEDSSVEGEPAAKSADTADDDDVPPPSKKSKKKKKKQQDAAAKMAQMQMQAQPKKEGIKTLPLIFLLIMTGSTVLPALIFAGDWVGNMVQKNNLIGGVGYRLGIGATPKKRVMSFYEKHDPTKINEVPNILAKHYGDYPKMIKRMERKYQDYGYFMGWEEDEAPLALALEQLDETRAYVQRKWNKHAPLPLKTAARNFHGNMNVLHKKFMKVWKKTLWPMLEPIFGVPKGGAAQKRKDAQEAKKKRSATSGRRKKNTDFRDDVEEE